MAPGTRDRTAKSDAYTGLLLISLLAVLAGVVLLYADYSSYPESKPKLPSRPAPAQPGS